MIENDRHNYEFRDAHIIFKNFAGVGGVYNREGDKNFCLLLSQEEADILTNNGWNVKVRPPRDEDDEPTYYTQIKVAFGNYPPNIWKVTKNGHKVRLDADTVGELDNLMIQHLDICVRPYHWVRPDGSEGVKGYLKTMYVIAEEDEFADMYVGPEEDEEDIPF